MCDQLKVYKVYTTRNEGAFGFCEGADITDIELEHESVCLKSDVDKAIAELKDVIHELRVDLEHVKNGDCINTCDVLEKYGKELRQTRRALWTARANRVIEKIAWFKLWNASISTMNPEDGARQEFDKWKKNLGKFLKKVEQYR